MSKGIILSLCDYTGTMVGPWLQAGYDACIVDPQHDKTETIYGKDGAGNLTKIADFIDSADFWIWLKHRARDIVFISAFPPCTDLAVSGARWFREKADKDPAFQFKAMQVVWQCYDIARMVGSPYLIENPVSQISSFWRKPDHSFHPWHYSGYCPGDSYTKKTCLWTGQGFVMPEISVSPDMGEPDNRIHAAPPGPERANFRSATPKGFAMAVFERNRKDIRELVA